MSFTLPDKSSHNPYKLPNTESKLTTLLKNKNEIANVLNFKKGQEHTFKMNLLPMGHNIAFKDQLFKKAGKDKKAQWLLDTGTIVPQPPVPFGPDHHRYRPRIVANAPQQENNWINDSTQPVAPAIPAAPVFPEIRAQTVYAPGIVAGAEPPPVPKPEVKPATHIYNYYMTNPALNPFGSELPEFKFS